MSNSTASYRQRKEDFVSNLSGGPVSEISNVTAIATVAMVLWSVLQARQSFFKPYTLLGFVVDFLLNVGAILLAFTLHSGSPTLLHLFLLAPAVLIYALPPNLGGSRKKPKLPPNAASKASGTEPLNVLSIKPYITTYRGWMMVSTAIAILAVDFKVFPRRFAKVETWGTSLMDLGVGSFVFSSGVVAARPVLKERASGKTTPLSKRLVASLRHSLPLLALGFIRLLSVKGVDYVEHVAEYGVHWNFFFTLGLLPPFVAVFQSMLKIVPSYAALALLLGVFYQVALESTGLKAYILTAPRVDLISMNREGIFSFVGYLAIFLAGQDAGMFVLPRSLNPNSKDKGATQRLTTLMMTGVWAAVWTGLYLLATDVRWGAGLTVSRRMANLPYVLWVAAFNLAQILACAAVDTFFFPAFYNAADGRAEREAYDAATSRVLRAYNRNGLAVFLVANLLTGAVNLTVPTLDVGPAVAMGILVAYALVLTVSAVGLDMYDISIKL
ncbi:uncharacterized protein E0L32_009263 [Thyridium curvatum]|uniref:GPI-anchored wall transfer protein n=1 Tax=Thyridium curvatum TaxID=1093900 RepID=A0A507AZ54_9PEZI|nr:uncharacterized protein E0L32_009263 [Thyridium curvatum]TPX09520.1 hypothetical protein E0L32_009263 [Thyridium curvatum]